MSHRCFTGHHRPVTKSTAGRDRLIITGLLLLALIPVAGGAFRVTELGIGAEATPDNARFFADPAPVVVHVIGAVLLALLAPFQFISGLRRRNLRWHRFAGRVIVPSGLAVALSGIWMTLWYDVPAVDGNAVYAMRLVFGSAMAAAFVLGVVAVRRRDIARHSAWMIRGYAIGMAAGTQAFTHLPWLVAGSTPGVTGRAMAMGAGWIINIVVAEWIIRSRTRRTVVSEPARAAL
jgi:uncharacterized membrane protein